MNDLKPSLVGTSFKLRPFIESDRDNFNFVEDEKWKRYLFHQFPNRDAFVDNCLNSKDAIDLVIAGNHHLIGSIHLGLSAPSYIGELACMISPSYWRRGIAFEACQLLLGHAFAKTKLTKAIAHCDARNTGSWRTLEKLGMVGEGLLRKNRLTRENDLVDELVYGLLREEWQNTTIN